MERIPFLIAVFLGVNPILEWVFRKREVNPEKLQFWVMVTTGTGWVIALLYFLLAPEAVLEPRPRPDLELLPDLHFSFDWISTALILAAAGLIFITVLVRHQNPRENAWLAGLGGACVIALGSYSAYTLALAWTVLEIFHFYFSIQDRQIASNPRKFLPVALIRFSAPGILIISSLTQIEPGSSIFDDTLIPSTGLLLIAAGWLGFVGWFLSYKRDETAQRGYFPGAVENWIPGLVGMMLMIRGGVLAGNGPALVSIPLSLSIGLLFVSIAGMLLDRTPGMWFLACGLLVAVSAIIAGPQSALSWSLVMALPATRFWMISANPRKSLILLALALLGLVPIPYFPAWIGVLAFQEGLAGVLLGLSYGILLGGALLTALKNWRIKVPEPESHPVPGMIGAAGLLVSQVLISFRMGLIDASQGLLVRPIQVWLSLPGLVAVLLLGSYLPLKRNEAWTASWARIRSGLVGALSGAENLIDRLVGLVSEVFEGQGGLIWALLIGLLIITLISMGGA